MSGLEVIGGISAIIAILDACCKIYTGARKDLRLTTAFRTCEVQLPIINATLQVCKGHLELQRIHIPVDAQDALEKILERCEGNAEKLRIIFSKVIADESDGWDRRYRKIWRSFGKGNKVEELMETIAQDVQVVVNHRAVQVPYPSLDSKLDKIILDLQALEPSISDDGNISYVYDSGGGMQNINTGSGNQYNIGTVNGTVNINHVTNCSPTPTPMATPPPYKRSLGVRLGRAACLDTTLFVGRELEIQHIDDTLRSNPESTRRRCLVLSGMGGMGKTQLSLAYAQRFGHSYSSVLWLSAKTESTLQQGMVDCAKEIFVDNNTVTELNLNSDQWIQKMRWWLSEEWNDQWLLILDNYDDPKLPHITSDTGFDIQTLLPTRFHGSILITSRNSNLGFGQTLQLVQLQLDDSVAVLTQRASRDLSKDQHVRELSSHLCGLPLALATAGSLIGKTNMSCSEYLHYHREKWTILYGSATQKLPEYDGRTMYSTWEVTWDHVRRHDPDAGELLQFLAYFGCCEIWYELLKAKDTQPELPWIQRVLGTKLSFQQRIIYLQDYNLIHSSSTTGYEVHPCLHEWLIERFAAPPSPVALRYALQCVCIHDAKHDQPLPSTVFGKHMEHVCQVRFLNVWQTCLSDKVMASTYREIAKWMEFLRKEALVVRICELAIEHYKIFGNDRSLVELRLRLCRAYLGLDKPHKAASILRRLDTWASGEIIPPGPFTDFSAKMTAMDNACNLASLYTLFDRFDDSQRLYARLNPLMLRDARLRPIAENAMKWYILLDFRFDSATQYLNFHMIAQMES